MIYSTNDLADTLETLKAMILSGDSIEGSISYTCMEEHLAVGDWEVTGCYRMGNADGQGGMRILPHGDPDQHPAPARTDDDGTARAVMSLFKHLIGLDHQVEVGGGAYVLPFYRALADWARANDIDLSRGGPVHVVDFSGSGNLP